MASRPNPVGGGGLGTRATESVNRLIQINRKELIGTCDWTMRSRRSMLIFSNFDEFDVKPVFFSSRPPRARCCPPIIAQYVHCHTQ